MCEFEAVDILRSIDYKIHEIVTCEFCIYNHKVFKYLEYDIIRVSFIFYEVSDTCNKWSIRSARISYFFGNFLSTFGWCKNLGKHSENQNTKEVCVLPLEVKEDRTTKNLSIILIATIARSRFVLVKEQHLVTYTKESGNHPHGVR